MTRGLFTLGRWCAEHARRVIVLWLGLLCLLGGAHLLLPPPALDPFVLAGTESAQAQVLLIRAFPGAATEAAPLVVHADADLREGVGKTMVEAVVEAVRGLDGVSGVTSPFDDDLLMSADGRTVIVSVALADRASGDIAFGKHLLQTATETAHAHDPAAQVALGDFLGELVSGMDTGSAEIPGIGIALVVLAVVMRRIGPVLIPLVCAGMAVGVGLSITKLLARMVYIPTEAPTLVMMLGLGVGIDYALFLITRHKLLLRKGYPVLDSIARTSGTAGAGLVFAGATLLAAMGGLSLTGISFLAWLGYSAAVMVAVVLGAALTLVPALLGLLGARVLPREQEVTYLRRQADMVEADLDSAEARHDADRHLDDTFWAKIADQVTSHPWIWALGSGIVLLALATPMLGMRFQQTDATALPSDTTAHQATVLINAGFGPGFNGPLAVVGQLYRPASAPQNPAAGGDPRAQDARLVRVSERLETVAGVKVVGEPILSPDGGVVLWQITPRSGPSDPATEALVSELRTEVLPAAIAGGDMSAYVGGVTAARTDLTQRVAARLVPFILGVAGLSFLLLLLAYRSLVIPLKAALMNLVGISAAYGVVVMVFQWGWGARLIGLDGPVPIESYVPMMMFAVLFGLSMDYEVFLLTAFAEHYARTGEIVTAIRRGLADTGQVITSAALIMVAVFASFVVTDAAIIKMFGVGLATAVLVDATVVRCILVPALMVLAARWTWWLPSWLDRLLPHLHVEGDPAALDGESAPREPQPADRHPAGSSWIALAGLVSAWMVGIQFVDAEHAAAVLAVAIAAWGGVLSAWLPRATRGAGQLLLTRTLAYLLGTLLAVASYLVVGAAQPPVDRNAAWQVGSAVLVPLLLVSATRLRRVALPVAAGAVSAAAALSSYTPVPSTMGVVMPLVALPALVGVGVVWLLVSLRSVVRPVAEARGEPPAGAPEVELEADDGRWEAPADDRGRQVAV
ncbi:MAG: MMPL family transporter [Candidatus Nanopelagicales bacterium]